ncbi:MAG: translation initiation factor IF-2 [Phycisphaerales bacterium]|nr:translation initiation factor IF-2 [Phycisphaerales bacterium]
MRFAARDEVSVSLTEHCLSKKVTLRVHQLAKELGLNSKDIVARCISEDVPNIEDHLSAVSLGLAETIRDWFKTSAGTVAAGAKAHATIDGAEDAGGVATAVATSTRSADAPATLIRSRGSKGAGSVTTVGASGEEAAPEALTDAPKKAVRKAPKKSAVDAPVVAEQPSTPAAVPSAPATEHAHEVPTIAAATEVAAPVADADVVPSVEVSAPAHAAPHAPVHAPKHAATHAPSHAPKPATPGGAPLRSTTSAPVVVAASAAPTTPVVAKPAAPRMIAGLSSRFIPVAGLSAKLPPREVNSPRSGRPDGTRALGAAPTPPVAPAAPARRFITAPPPPPASLGRMDGASPVMNVPTRPTSVSPGGTKLETLSKISLTGPKMIRMEAPENLPAPRRATTGTAGTRSGTTAGASTGRGGPRVREGGAGRMARSGNGPQTISTQDQADRNKRMASSGGFMRGHQYRPGTGGGGGGGPRVVNNKPPEAIHVSEPVTIKELSAATGVKSVDIIKKLFLAGMMANINSSLDREKAIEVMMDFEIELIVDEAKSVAEIIEERFKDRVRTSERRRAPIITILGHVDHGKTSLLDRIRSTNIAAGEAGGITQSTRAFAVPVKAGEVERVVSFIDTPGHEAFTNMRARGAKVTDIVVLVVSAIDGVMPQTVESINHAKAAGVPIVVALNKIDHAGATEANIQKTLGQLATAGVNVHEWGGTVDMVRTSATRGDGIQELLEMLDYQAELLDLKADFEGSARGTVLEASIEEGRGPVAQVMIQEGRLKKGDFIVVGRGFGRVRDILNDRGERLKEAFPSTPVAISGLDQLPDAGDMAYVVETIRAAEDAAEERRRMDRERELAVPKITLDNIFSHLEKQGRKELAIVIKGDVQGSVEALKGMLSRLPMEEVTISVKHAAVGGITEGDITLAEATKAIVLGFNVTSSGKARQIADQKNVEIRLYEVIYDLIDDVTKAARGMLAPELRLEVLGHAEVRQVFTVSKVGAVAGCYITDGVVERNAQIRVTRNGIVIEKDRRLEQLKRFKDDAKDVRMGQECGMKIAGYDNIMVGDVLECYKTISVART